LPKARRLIFASHNERLVGSFRDAVGPCGIDVLSLTDVGLPDPSASARDIVQRATIRAAVVAALTGMPTVALARGFFIDPLLRWGGGGPQWSWPVPWPYTDAELAAELWQAHNNLDAGGYCGPDDRGAYFRSVLCLLICPEAEPLILDGRLEGQFGGLGYATSPKPDHLLDDYFVPDGETVALADLPAEARRRYADEVQALEAFRRAACS
jgi:XTP/dITP diphosphohydrolase